MARGRMLVRRIGESYKVSRLYEAHGAGAALCWTWMIAWLDRNGNMRGDPAWIKVAVMPRMDVAVSDVEDWIQKMVEVELVVPYEIDGMSYLHVPGFRGEQIGMRWDRERPEVPIPAGFDEETATMLAAAAPKQLTAPAIIDVEVEVASIGKLSLGEVVESHADLPTEWLGASPSTDEVIAWWIDAMPERPPAGGIKRMGKVAGRIAAANSRQDIIRAVLGMSLIFPHADKKVLKNSPGRLWDLFDLEKKFTAAWGAVRPENKTASEAAFYEHLGGSYAD